MYMSEITDGMKLNESANGEIVTPSSKNLILAVLQ